MSSLPGKRAPRYAPLRGVLWRGCGSCHSWLTVPFRCHTIRARDIKMTGVQAWRMRKYIFLWQDGLTGFDLPSFDAQPVLAEEPDCFREGDMFLYENAVGKDVLVVLVHDP